MARVRLATTVAAVLVFFAFAAHAASPPVAVTTCGQVVPAKTTGYLVGDLDCSGFTGGPSGVDPFYAGAAVYLERKASLDLRGFTLTGGLRGVVCQNSCGRDHCAAAQCTVFGGTVIGNEGEGIAGERLTVRDVHVSGFASCIYSYGKSIFTDIVVDDCSAVCVQTGNTRTTGAQISNCGGPGIMNNSNRTAMRIAGSSISDTGNGPYCNDAASCASIYTDRQPNLKNTSCETSGAPASVKPSRTWNVCALD